MPTVKYSNVQIDPVCMISSFKFKGLYRISFIFQNGDDAILILIDERLSVLHGFRRKNFRGWRSNGQYKEGSFDDFPRMWGQRAA